MVVTRRGALAQAQRSPPPANRAARRDRRTRQKDLPKTDSSPVLSKHIDTRKARGKKRAGSEAAIDQQAGPSSKKVAIDKDPDQQAPHPQVNPHVADEPKPSLFGFKFDQMTTSVSNRPFDPTLCYQFASSFPSASILEPKNAKARSSKFPAVPIDFTSNVHNQPNPKLNSPMSKHDEEFAAMKLAINTATRLLVSALDTEPTDQESRALMEGILADPSMRARVPAQLLEAYEEAKTSQGDQQGGMKLMNYLVSVTAKAAQCAKQMVDNNRAARAKAKAEREARLRIDQQDPGVDDRDPAFDRLLQNALSYNLSQAADASDESPFRPPPFNARPIPNEGLSNSHPTPIPPQKVPEANPPTDQDMSGFEVESVAPTIIEAPTFTAPALASSPAPVPTISTSFAPTLPLATASSLPTPTNLTAPAPERNTARDVLMQTSGVDLNRILDPSSKEYRCVRKARAMLAAIRMTAGSEEAEEVYTGMQLMVFYDMVGMLSTDIYSHTYQRVLGQSNTAGFLGGGQAGPSQIPGGFGPPLSGFTPPPPLQNGSFASPTTAFNAGFVPSPQIGIGGPSTSFVPPPSQPNFAPLSTGFAHQPQTDFSAFLQSSYAGPSQTGFNTSLQTAFGGPSHNAYAGPSQTAFTGLQQTHHAGPSQSAFTSATAFDNLPRSSYSTAPPRQPRYAKIAQPNPLSTTSFIPNQSTYQREASGSRLGAGLGQGLGAGFEPCAFSHTPSNQGS